MHTCPACGEETEAGYAEACTECGFSPTGEPAEPVPAEPDPEVEPTAEVGPDAEVEPTADAEPSPMDAPPPPPPARKKRPGTRLVFWLIAIAAVFGISKLGVFEPNPGPDASEVEDAIVKNAADYGVTVTVDCPDDADETAVEESFFCTVTTPSGKAFRIRVTNHEDTFSWPSDRFAALGQAQ